MNWTDLLRSAGIPEPPGYTETCQAMQDQRKASPEALQALPKGSKRKRKGKSR